MNIWSYFKSENIIETNPDAKTEDLTNSGNDVDKTPDDWGNYLIMIGRNAKDMASKQVTETARKIKENVSEMNMMDEGNILVKFTEEQNKFRAEQQQMQDKMNSSSLPWLKSLLSENVSSQALKQKILNVSEDNGNFLRDPPPGSEFEFDYEALTPVMCMLLEEDSLLAQKRYDLVPKKLKERIFWRNYFYRINLIKQSMFKDNDSIKQDDIKEENISSQSIQDKYNLCDSVDDDTAVEFVSDSPVNNSTDERQHKQTNSNKINKSNLCDSVNDDTQVEFVSDSRVNNSTDEIQHKQTNSNKINEIKLDGDTDDLEAELQKELCEFELVNEENGSEVDIMGAEIISSSKNDNADYDDLEREILNELEN